MANNELQRLPFGNVIEIGEYRRILEEKGGEGLVRDQYHQRMHAGFLDGLPGNDRSLCDDERPR